VDVVKLDDTCVYKLATDSIDNEIEQNIAEINNCHSMIEDINIEMLHMRSSGKKDTQEYKELASKRRHYTYLFHKYTQKLKKVSDDSEIYKLEKRKIDLME
jgi:predicted RNase H-like nuclease (RuvC/YqgF family)